MKKRQKNAERKSADNTTMLRTQREQVLGILWLISMANEQKEMKTTKHKKQLWLKKMAE